MSTQNYPEAVESEFFAGLSEEPITLYSGAAVLCEDGIDHSVQLEVVLRGRPRNRITFHASGESLRWRDFPERCSLRIAESSDVLPASINYLNRGLRTGSISDFVIFPDDVPVRRVLFGVPNFTHFLGEVARYASGAIRRGRIELASDDWAVTLDAVGRDVISRLREEGGVATSHIARVERTDGMSFLAEDFRDVIRGIEIYLSFVAAATIGITVAHGLDEDGNPKWEVWRAAKMHPFQNRQSWADAHHAEMAQASFREFMRLWSDSEWRRTLSNAVQWYVAAIQQAGYLEGAIILSQSVLELLACSFLPGELSFGPATQIERAPAHCRIRWLLEWINVRPEIPAELDLLLQWQAQESFSDGPMTLARIRNDLIHPERGNRERLARIPDGVYFQAWTYALWIAELSLLKKLGYGGSYANRITQSRVGQVEPVPWA